MELLQTLYGVVVVYAQSAHIDAAKWVVECVDTDNVFERIVCVSWTAVDVVVVMQIACRSVGILVAHVIRYPRFNV